MFRNRIVPLIVAVSLFMENMDSTVIATALPAIAADLGTNPLALKLAITSYLLALAIFIPASGWTADRFGSRTVFRIALAIFMIGSIGCAFAGSLGQFVVARFIQGMGGAMMSPVGRLVMLRSFDKREIVAIMTWVTMPALIGPVLGPPVGGFITTYFSWHWIFLHQPADRPARHRARDALFREHSRRRIRAVRLSRHSAGRLRHRRPRFRPDHRRPRLPAARRRRRAADRRRERHHRAMSFTPAVTPAPILDLRLFSLPTFRASVVGGFIFRIGVGALPFLMPLLLQLGFIMTPFQSGLITFSTALGAMSMKAVVPYILRRFGFRPTLIVNALVSSAAARRPARCSRRARRSSS